MSCCSANVKLDRARNVVTSTEDAREWVDPLGRPCPEDAKEPWYDPGTKCCTDGVYWWHRDFKKSAQLVRDFDIQPLD